MEHIVQFAIGVDDNVIKERIEKNVEKEVIKTITEKVEDVIYSKYAYYDTKEPLKNMVKARIDVIFTEEKDTIVEMASKILADRLLKSKKGKALLEQFEVQDETINIE